MLDLLPRIGFGLSPRHLFDAAKVGPGGLTTTIFPDSKPLRWNRQFGPENLRIGGEKRRANLLIGNVNAVDRSACCSLNAPFTTSAGALYR
jgi:hypothetical protein